MTIFAFLTLSLTCFSSLLFLLIIYPKYFISFTSSILSSPHHQNLSFSLPPPFLKPIIFDFSMFSSNCFPFRYFLNAPIKFLISASPSATNATSSAYSKHQILSFPIFTPFVYFLISSSKSAMYTLNRVGLSGHPCLTPFPTQNISLS
ncbi:hypothetical protein ALC56_00911 [Trachymyrmex septentrionalis]|uniref:Uncharacterized protein n=1 Tax=Trachymyrmex septentrionalis TaxID=34720 RepID=A0A151K195_9HYME|nr:hypothetical protein ALC56_00911 [Trachymyrmex septentrionalis]